MKKKPDYFMSLEKKKAKIKKRKKKYNVTCRVQNYLNSSIAEQFKIYLDSLLESEKDEIQKDFHSNGNGFLTIRENKSTL